jgi:hypothetical protein
MRYLVYPFIYLFLLCRNIWRNKMFRKTLFRYFICMYWVKKILAVSVLQFLLLQPYFFNICLFGIITNALVCQGLLLFLLYAEVLCSKNFVVSLCTMLLNYSFVVFLYNYIVNNEYLFQGLLFTISQ